VLIFNQQEKSNRPKGDDAVKVYETEVGREYLRNGIIHKALYKSPGLTVFMANNRRVALMNDTDILPAQPTDQPIKPIVPKEENIQETNTEETNQSQDDKSKVGEGSNGKIRKSRSAGNKKESRAAKR
jgi:hypothetical protein